MSSNKWENDKDYMLARELLARYLEIDPYCIERNSRDTIVINVEGGGEFWFLELPMEVQKDYKYAVIPII